MSIQCDKCGKLAKGRKYEWEITDWWQGTLLRHLCIACDKRLNNIIEDAKDEYFQRG